MNKAFITLITAMLVCSGSISAQIVVSPDDAIGPIKRMNAVNNGPRINNAEQVYTGTTGYFRAANVGYSRNHDAAGYGAYGEHVVDISIIFPDFSKNPDRPESYDFTLTDRYVKSIQDAGVEVFYRLGQSIENQPLKKYNIYPPKDNKKWAQICEHIIRHYIKSWTDDYPYSVRAMSSPKAGAFVCASMQEGQSCPTDMMMYYVWAPGSKFNGLFDQLSDTPIWPYWALYSWGKLKTLGTQVKASCDIPDVRVTAARDAEGHRGILVSRYTMDDNITAVKDVTVQLAGGARFDSGVRCHITDEFNLYTEYPVALQEDGTLLLQLYPHSFVFIEE